MLVCASLLIALGFANIGIEVAAGSGAFGPLRGRPAGILIPAVNCFTLLSSLGLYIAWCVWVYRIHREFREFTYASHPISPGRAVGFCFIPFFSLYWMVYMPYQHAKSTHGYLRTGTTVVNPSSVLTFQILAIVPGYCWYGLSMLFMALAARSIQNGLNELWKQARSEMERSGDLGLPIDR